MNCWDSPLDKITYYPLTDTVKYETFSNEEAKMSLTKRYANRNRSADEQLAIDEGLLREDGTLTSEGREFLCQILFDDKSIKEKFYEALRELIDEEDEED